MFFNGFEKTAAGASWLSAAKSFGKGLQGGLGAAAKGTVGDAVKLKGLASLTSAAGAKGTLNKARQIGEGLGKAAPSLAVAGAGAVAAKKVYDKTLGSTQDQSYYY